VFGQLSVGDRLPPTTNEAFVLGPGVVRSERTTPSGQAAQVMLVRGSYDGFAVTSHAQASDDGPFPTFAVELAMPVGKPVERPVRRRSWQRRRAAWAGLRECAPVPRLFRFLSAHQGNLGAAAGPTGLRTDLGSQS
jgi:hypothetical protein